MASLFAGKLLVEAKKADWVEKKSDEDMQALYDKFVQEIEFENSRKKPKYHVPEVLDIRTLIRRIDDLNYIVGISLEI